LCLLYLILRPLGLWNRTCDRQAGYVNASPAQVLDLGDARASDAGVRYGLGWRYGLADEHQSEGGLASTQASGGGQGRRAGRPADPVGQPNLWDSVPPEIAWANERDVELYASARVLSLLDAMMYAYVASAGEAVAPTAQGCGLLNRPWTDPDPDPPTGQAPQGG
jgi:hypothetical protein